MKTGHLTPGLFRATVMMLLLLAGLAALHADASAGSKMNLLIYIMGSDLEEDVGAASRDIKEMLRADPPEGTSVYLFLGGSRRWALSDEYGGASAYLNVTDGQIVELKRPPDAECGTTDSLSDFIRFCTDRSPSECNALILWGHGCEGMQGIGYDSVFNEDTLSLNELSAGLAQAGVFWDLIGFDACSMATFETIWTLKDHTKFIIATPNDESVQGWPYHELLSIMEEPSDALLAEMKQLIEDSFHRQEHDIEICIVGSEALSGLEASLKDLFDAAPSVQMGTDLLTLCEECGNGRLTEEIRAALNGQCIRTGIYPDREAYEALLESGMLPQYCKWILRCNGWES